MRVLAIALALGACAPTRQVFVRRLWIATDLLHVEKCPVEYAGHEARTQECWTETHVIPTPAIEKVRR